MKIRLLACFAFLVIVGAAPAFAHGDIHDRISQLTAELDENPSAGLFFKRGLLNLKHGEAEAALTDFREADQLAPGEFETDTPRAEALTVLGKYSSALECLNRCIDRDLSASRCLVLRARVFHQLQKPEAAIGDYRKALSFVSQPEPELLLEVSAALAQNKQPTAALELLDHGIARLGQLPSLVTAAIEIDFRNGNVESALRRIDVARNAALRPEPWMARRASVLARAGRIAESRDAWQFLLAHIFALPSAEQSSHAMCSRVREAQDALAALESNPQ